VVVAAKCENEKERKRERYKERRPEFQKEGILENNLRIRVSGVAVLAKAYEGGVRVF
jgi:hypothetical protein